MCDLNPQKTCRFATKLVPRLKPSHQCTIVPKEVCTLKFTTPRQVKKPLLTKWCLDDSPVTQGQSYDESNSLADPIETSKSRNAQEDPSKSFQSLILDISDEEFVPEHDNINDSLITGLSFVKDEFIEHDDKSAKPSENGFDLIDLIDLIMPSDKLSEEEQEDLDNFNLGIQLEQFRTNIDNSFPTQDFSQFVDFEAF